MATLERAIAIAAAAHAGQVDKAGAPCILHPLRVMLQMDSEAGRVVGVLHDVVEDSDWDFEALAGEGFSTEVIDSLRAVTRSDDEDYGAFVRRAGRDPIGARVKLADLRDNSDLSRIAAPTERDHARLAKYQRAIAVLTGLVGDERGAPGPAERPARCPDPSLLAATGAAGHDRAPASANEPRQQQETPP
jgi:hypothetical protein